MVIIVVSIVTVTKFHNYTNEFIDNLPQTECGRNISYDEATVSNGYCDFKTKKEIQDLNILSYFWED